MRSSQERGPWYLLTGLLIGIVLGVLYTRYFQPVEYIDTSPALLRQDFKDQYRFLIAAAFSANGDLVRAKARLGLLKDPDVFRALSEQAQRTLAQNGSSIEARALGLLAIALGQAPPGPVLAVTQAAQPPTSAPSLATPADLNASIPTEPGGSASTPETLAASTPPAESTASPAGPFTLLNKEEICDLSLSEPLLQIQITDKLEQPVAGVLIIATWTGGEERFYTGLKPEQGPGYADYTIDPAIVYTLQVGENSQPVTDLEAADCQNAAGEHYWGAWLLTFVQP
jgi:hypothetical protein